MTILESDLFKMRTNLSEINFKYLFNGLIITTFVITSLLIENSIASSECSYQQYECRDKSKCIPLSWRCDGDFDCPDSSDEIECTIKQCTESEFKCQNGKCLPQKWICDNEDDCGDRSDEKDCANHTCAENHFKCVANSNCIPNEWVCDLTEDCSDGSDEMGCPTELVSCRQNEFTCDNGKCLISRWVCDGENDCGDNSDESTHLCANKTCATGSFTCDSGKCIPDRWKCDGDKDCHFGEDEVGCPTPMTKDECMVSEFMCHNGHECINKLWRCDRSRDCTDGSDELNCNYTCGPEEFMCQNGTTFCIPQNLKCNGVNDCSDGSDEAICDKTSTTPIPTKLCTATQHQCKDQSPVKCIEFNQLCDGKNDCGDWSDEPHNCGLNECEGTEHHCSQICIDDFSGYHCECKKGFRLDTDNKTCVDIDECAETYGLCSGHICLNLKGHFKCECYDGYEVKDHRFCKTKGEEKPLLMFANRHDIRTLDISQKHKQQHYTSLYSDLSSTISVDYSLSDNYLIWSDVANEKLFIAPFDSKNKTFNNYSEPHVLIDNHGVVDALTVDWIHRLVYWTDTSKDHIEVANISNPESRTILISDGLEEPRGIAVNVLESWIVWTDWGSEPKIERCLQDGSNRQVLVDKDIVWPNGVVIDMITERIYWLDAKLNSINAIDYDGQNRRLILHSTAYIRHPFSLDIFEDTIYWTDWELESVLATNKFGNDLNKVEALVGGIFSVMDIRVVHSYKKPNTPNRCSEHKCSHLCLPSGRNSYRCLCPSTMTLKNNTTCELTNPSTTTAPVVIAKTSTHSSLGPHLVPFTPESTVRQTTLSIAEIEIRKSLNEDKKDEFYHHNHNKSHSHEDSTTYEDMSEGNLALTITIILLVISLIIGTLTLFVYRKYQRRNITSMNFDNPVYRKTTEDQFALEKSDDSLSSYPSSLEPLTSPGTNEFV